MSQKVVLNHEDNLKVALFMNAEVVGEFPDHKLLSFPDKEFPNNWSKYHASNTLEYDKSFDWLMPVVKKVTLLCKNNLWNTDNTINEDFDYQWKKLFDYQSYNFFTADLDSVYTAVVNFLDWYNEYKTQKL